MTDQLKRNMLNQVGHIEKIHEGWTEEQIYSGKINGLRGTLRKLWLDAVH